MPVIKVECDKTEKEKFKEFCNLRDQKESAVLRRAIRKYMSDHQGVTDGLSRIKKSG